MSAWNMNPRFTDFSGVNKEGRFPPGSEDPDKGNEGKKQMIELTSKIHSYHTPHRRIDYLIRTIFLHNVCIIKQNLYC